MCALSPRPSAPRDGAAPHLFIVLWDPMRIFGWCRLWWWLLATRFFDSWGSVVGPATYRVTGRSNIDVRRGPPQ